MHLTIVPPSHAPTSGDDHALGDLAHDMMFAALDMADDAEHAARAMLLAVATIIHDDPTFGRAIPTSDILLAVVRKALDEIAGATGAADPTGTPH